MERIREINVEVEIGAALGVEIPLDRFGIDSTGYIDFSVLRVGEAYYKVNLKEIAVRRQAVEKAAPPNGWTVERLERAKEYEEQLESAKMKEERWGWLKEQLGRAKQQSKQAKEAAKFPSVSATNREWFDWSVTGATAPSLMSELDPLMSELDRGDLGLPTNTYTGRKPQQAHEDTGLGAVILYTGGKPPQFLNGVKALEVLTKSAQNAPGTLNLIITGAGSAVDLDALQLNIALRAGTNITFRTEPLHPRLVLDQEGVSVDNKGGLWVAVQRIGDVIITVVGATLDEAIERIAAIRMSLLASLDSSPKYKDHLLKGDDRRVNFNQAAFANDNFGEITESIAAGRKALMVDPKSVPLPEFDFGIQIHGEIRSQRFAVLSSTFIQRVAKLGESDAAR